MQDHWHLEHEHNYEYALSELLKRYEPAVACKTIDDRLEELVISHSVLSASQPTPASPGKIE